MKLGMMRRGLLALALVAGGPALAAGEAAHPPAMDWSFGGLFGTFDRASAQRGFQVYKEVCSACHAVKQLSYRNLSELGLTEDEVKAIAASYQVKDGPNDNGEMFERPGRPSDRFVSPYPNEKAARAAQNGAYPPDLSLMVKAREGGADYMHGLLTGYSEPPAGMTMGVGMNFNRYFPGNQIAMVAPLSDDRVTYADGTKATLDQMARDVTTFLAWAAEPELETRRAMGVRMILFLLVLTVLAYAVKKKIWADLH
jgi:ubiquinol-cytochrome c reductase cytochrome c1 subunit